MSDEKRVNVLLLKPHRHLGVSHIAGDVINVTSEQKDWLIGHGVAMVQPVNTETKQDKKS